MNKSLGHRVAVDVDVFDLLGRDVLALCQLEDVLLAVHDLQSAILNGQEGGKLSARDPVMGRLASGSHLTGSHLPMSPVWTQPSLSIVLAVISGSFR